LSCSWPPQEVLHSKSPSMHTTISRHLLEEVHLGHLSGLAHLDMFGGGLVFH